ncbi:MAP4K1 [Cordylochernes scorpioides]|uniref:MAP4K1 n=1 Tax=Cordylochernes scorpioides TaxID=51811 RepID=A0ABY6L1Q7_9ARAC|nr:MAP4K1 [Cordylochernes scorpioides]
MEEVNKRRRRAMRGNFTRLINDLNIVLKEPPIDSIRVDAKFNRIEVLYVELANLNVLCQSVLLAKDEATDEEVDREFQECEKYIWERFIMERRVRALREQGKDVLSTGGGNRDADLKNKGDLQKFKGNPGDWLSRWGQFDKINANGKYEDVDLKNKEDSEAESKGDIIRDSEAEPKGEEVKNSEAEPKGEGVKDSEAKPKDEGMNDSEDEPKGDGVKDSEAKPKGAEVKDSEAKPKGEGVKDSEAKPKDEGMKDSEDQPKGDGVKDSDKVNSKDGNEVKESEGQKAGDEGDGKKDSEAELKGGVKDSEAAVKCNEVKDSETAVDSFVGVKEAETKVQASRKLVEARPTGDTVPKIKGNYRETEAQDLKTINKSDYAENKDDKCNKGKDHDGNEAKNINEEQGTDSKVEEEKLDVEQGTDSKVAEEKLDVGQGTDSKVEEKLDAEQGTDSMMEEKIIDTKDWLKEGFIEGVNENSPEVKGCYLSRRLLFKKESRTTPIRPVFGDPSCREHGGLALRRYLRRRPNLLRRRIPEIGIKLRENKFGVLADMRRYFQTTPLRPVFDASSADSKKASATSSRNKKSRMKSMDLDVEAMGHDNARPHTARVTMDYLQSCRTLPWPARLPDLSPIEHIWDVMGRRLQPSWNVDYLPDS